MVTLTYYDKFNVIYGNTNVFMYLLCGNVNPDGFGSGLDPLKGHFVRIMIYLRSKPVSCYSYIYK